MYSAAYLAPYPFQMSIEVLNSSTLLLSVLSSGSCYFCCCSGESIPIRLFLAGYELTPTFKDVNKKFSVRYFLNLVLVDEEERRYFKQQVRVSHTRNVKSIR